MKPEKERLFNDLLNDGRRRDATLRAGAQILRRRRHWRAAQHAIVLILLAGSMTWYILSNRQGPRTAAVATEQKAPAPYSVPVLTDTQLLALFPDTPVALVKLTNGRKALVFPRPADEARYVVHL